MAAKTHKPHPVAALFPMLGADELQEMADDIAQRGLLQPIVLDTQDQILDGRNREAACKIAKVVPRYEIYDGDDPAGYALAANIIRRNLTTGARAVIAARAARLNGYGAQKQVAASTGISYLRISDANVVLDWAPDLADAIVAGSPLSTALKTARERKDAAAQFDAKIARLPYDLAELVRMESMDVDEAIAALEQREAKARQQADAAQREELARQEEEARQRRVATHLLCDSVVSLSQITAADVGKKYDPSEITPGRPVKLQTIRAAISSLQTLERIWKERSLP